MTLISYSEKFNFYSPSVVNVNPSLSCGPSTVLTPPPCPGSLLAGVNGFCRPRTKVPPRDLTFCVDNLVIYLANLCRVAGRAYVALCAFLALPHRAPGIVHATAPELDTSQCDRSSSS